MKDRSCTLTLSQFLHDSAIHSLAFHMAFSRNSYAEQVFGKAFQNGTLKRRFKFSVHVTDGHPAGSLCDVINQKGHLADIMVRAISEAVEICDPPQSPESRILKVWASLHFEAGPINVTTAIPTELGRSLIKGVSLRFPGVPIEYSFCSSLSYKAAA